MKLPDTDDLMLFGSFFVVAAGTVLVTYSTTRNQLLAMGLGLLVYGVLCAVVTFMAAGEPE